MRPLLLILLVLVSLCTQPGSVSSPHIAPPPPPTGVAPEPQRRSEFPPRDVRIWQLQSAGLNVKAAARRLVEAPEGPDMIGLLLGAGRTDDALRVLRWIVDTRPDQMAAAFKMVGRAGDRIREDTTRRYPDALRAIVAAAKTRLHNLPRAQAARTALELVSIDSALSPSFRLDTWLTLLSAFVSDYADTEEGLLAHVDVIITAADMSARTLDQLHALAQTHPGTTVAARALHAEAFYLRANAATSGEHEERDPTERFFRVLKIARELEGGNYPASQWVSDAPSLVWQFFSYEPVYAPANLERVLAAQEEYVKTHLRIEGDDPLSDAVRYFITTGMASLFRLKGDAVAGVEGVLSRLEQSSDRPDAVRYLRAQFYLRPPEGSSDDQQRRLRTKAQDTLESLYASSTGFYRRKALATLATLHFEQRRHAEARRLYEKYVDAYPDSDYAWVAALRIGQCDEATNDPKRAANAFRLAAGKYSSNPIARVLGHAYAARALEAAGDFQRALVEDQAALAAWDDDYGSTYSLFSMRLASPNEPFLFADDAEVAKHALSARTSQLERSTSAAGGTIVEKGRWLLTRGRWDDAIAALSPLVRSASVSAPGVEARYLSHQARLERALDSANVERSGSDDDTASKELGALSREPFDFVVGAAKMALATLASVGRAPGDAGAMMAEALTACLAAHGPALPSAPRGALERDVAAIRNAVFLPRGGGVFGNTQWNAFSWSDPSAQFLVVDPELKVRLSDGKVVHLTFYDPFPSLDNVVFLSRERRALLERIMINVGGTRKGQPRSVMEVNRPAGDTVHVLVFWTKFFAARPGHWGGWVFETYPIIDQIEFVDAERTRATVQITVGYSGGTVHMERKDGAWIATALTNVWLT